MNTPNLNLPTSNPSTLQPSQTRMPAELEGFALAGRHDAVGVAHGGVAAVADKLAGPWKRLEGLKREIADLLSTQTNATQADASIDSPEFISSMRESNLRLLELQMKAQSCTLEIELLSKVTEQSTSSTKQVLQTQA